MSEIKCPHCGEVFKVDEQGYAAIVAQVKPLSLIKSLTSVWLMKKTRL